MGFPSIIENICNKVLIDTELLWFQEKLEKLKTNHLPKDLYLAFGLVHRKINKNIAVLDSSDLTSLKEVFPEFGEMTWSSDQICRLAFMLTVPKKENKKLFVNMLNAGDVNEQIALYKAIYFLENANDFILEVVNGIRTNITSVFDSIALENPFPTQNFTEEAWNQMVLKAIFMDRPIFKIPGLEERKNENLANTLQDYAHERWAAGRSVTPELWRLTSGFVDEKLLSDLQRVISNDISLAKEVAIKVINESSFQPARDWLSKQNLQPSSKSWAELGTLSLQTKE
ncbi:MAG: EboA domain-containing protein [Flavobacteriales bacterium]|nr:EboA domain-containing protein [Flavobacteriales bacterium]